MAYSEISTKFASALSIQKSSARNEAVNNLVFEALDSSESLTEFALIVGYGVHYAPTEHSHNYQPALPNDDNIRELGQQIAKSATNSILPKTRQAITTAINQLALNNATNNSIMKCALIAHAVYYAEGDKEASIILRATESALKSLEIAAS